MKITWDENGNRVTDDGLSSLTVRQWYKGLAMQAFLVNFKEDDDFDEVAQWCEGMADCMIADDKKNEEMNK